MPRRRARRDAQICAGRRGACLRRFRPSAELPFGVFSSARPQLKSAARARFAGLTAERDFDQRVRVVTRLAAASSVTREISQDRCYNANLLYHLVVHARHWHRRCLMLSRCTNKITLPSASLRSSSLSSSSPSRSPSSVPTRRFSGTWTAGRHRSPCDPRLRPGDNLHDSHGMSRVHDPRRRREGVGGTSDQFMFVYQRLTGDGAVTLRLLSLAGTSTMEAGLMMRESLTATVRTPCLDPGGRRGVHRSKPGDRERANGVARRWRAGLAPSGARRAGRSPRRSRATARSGRSYAADPGPARDDLRRHRRVEPRRDRARRRPWCPACR